MAREADRENDMTMAPERPVPSVTEGVKSLLDIAEDVFQHLPGYRPEIIGGQLVVNPPPDGPHQDSIMSLGLALAVLHSGETRILPGVGLWLPNGEDYVIPDMAVVDADYQDHLVAFNCYAPGVFRMVVEITSSNRKNDTEDKRHAYADAGVPVYLIADRKRREAVLLTDPRDGKYRTRSVFEPGESLTLPKSVGAEAEVDVDTLLGPAPKK
jgi:Uma2 family endonuclease